MVFLEEWNKEKSSSGDGGKRRISRRASIFSHPPSPKLQEKKRPESFGITTLIQWKLIPKIREQIEALNKLFEVNDAHEVPVNISKLTDYSNALSALFVSLTHLYSDITAITHDKFLKNLDLRVKQAALTKFLTQNDYPESSDWAIKKIIQEVSLNLQQSPKNLSEAAVSLARLKKLKVASERSKLQEKIYIHLNRSEYLNTLKVDFFQALTDNMCENLNEADNNFFNALFTVHQKIRDSKKAEYTRLRVNLTLDLVRVLTTWVIQNKELIKTQSLFDFSDNSACLLEIFGIQSQEHWKQVLNLNSYPAISALKQVAPIDEIVSAENKHEFEKNIEDLELEFDTFDKKLPRKILQKMQGIDKYASLNKLPDHEKFKFSVLNEKPNYIKALAFQLLHLICQHEVVGNPETSPEQKKDKTILQKRVQVFEEQYHRNKNDWSKHHPAWAAHFILQNNLCPKLREAPRRILNLLFNDYQNKLITLSNSNAFKDLPFFFLTTKQKYVLHFIEQISSVYQHFIKSTNQPLISLSHSKGTQAIDMLLTLFDQAAAKNPLNSQANQKINVSSFLSNDLAGIVKNHFNFDQKFYWYEFFNPYFLACIRTVQAKFDEQSNLKTKTKTEIKNEPPLDKLPLNMRWHIQLALAHVYFQQCESYKKMDGNFCNSEEYQSLLVKALKYYGQAKTSASALLHSDFFSPSSNQMTQWEAPLRQRNLIVSMMMWYVIKAEFFQYLAMKKEGSDSAVQHYESVLLNLKEAIKYDPKARQEILTNDNIIYLQDEIKKRIETVKCQKKITAAKIAEKKLSTAITRVGKEVKLFYGAAGKKIGPYIEQEVARYTNSLIAQATLFFKKNLSQQSEQFDAFYTRCQMDLEKIKTVLPDDINGKLILKNIAVALACVSIGAAVFAAVHTGSMLFAMQVISSLCAALLTLAVTFSAKKIMTGHALFFTPKQDYPMIDAVEQGLEACESSLSC